MSASSSPRILLLASEFPPGPGGIGTHAYQLAEQLARRGWELHVLTPQDYVTNEVRNAFNQHLPFEVTTLPERGDNRGWWQQRLKLIMATMRSFRPDILIASGRRALWTATAITQRYPVPMVIIGHGTEFLGHSRPARFMTTRALKRATAVVAVSNYTARLIQQLAAPARLVVIPNWADGERFYTKAPDGGLAKELGLSGQCVLLTVGHVSERKAQDIVIRALPRVIARHHDVVYVMAGLPTRRDELQELADELGVGTHIRFAGSVPDERLADYYNLADLFVLVSRQTASGDVEGYGIVVQEAALCGKPAVVSQGFGLTEAIEDGVTGISVPAEDPDATAEAIIDLLTDQPRRLEMGRQAQIQASQGTWDQRIEAYDTLLRDIRPTRS